MKNTHLSFALFLMTTLAGSTHAQASGVITVKGKLVSITPKVFIVKTELATYSIARAAVEPTVSKAIDRPEVQVSFTVPFEAVDKIKPLRQ